MPPAALQVGEGPLAAPTMSIAASAGRENAAGGGARDGTSAPAERPDGRCRQHADGDEEG